MTDFIPGLDLTESFFHTVLRPLLADAFPQLRYAAARLGSGSDVLGYDTPMSMDHDWGVRMQLFLLAADHERVATAVDALLCAELPIHAGRFADSLRAAINNEKIRTLPLIGSVDQFSDSTDLREDKSLLRRLDALYDPYDDSV